MAIFRFKIFFLLIILMTSCSDDKVPEQVKSPDIPELLKRENTQNAKPDSLLQIEVPLDELEEFEFSENDFKQLAETGKADFVINLRKAFNDFINGKAESPYFEKSALNAVGDNLNSFNKNYFKSKFIVLSVNQDYPVGGVFLDIIFRDMPDKVFTAWMFETENIFKLRIIEQNLDYTSSEIKATLKLFNEVFKRDDTAF